MNSKFDDDNLPERFHLPPNVLFPQFERLVQTLQQQTLESIANQVPKEQRQDFLSTTTASSLKTITFKPKKVLITLSGADAAELYDIETSNLGKYGFNSVTTYLYHDGSPFAFDEDMEEFPNARPIDLEGFTIYASPEYPAFIVSDAAMEGMHSDPTKYLAALREQGRSPRFLSEEECMSLLQALGQQEVNIDDVISQWVTHYF